MKRGAADEKTAHKARAMLARMKPLAVWAFWMNGETFRAVEKLGGPAGLYEKIAGSLGELAGLAGDGASHG